MLALRTWWADSIIRVSIPTYEQEARMSPWILYFLGVLGVFFSGPLAEFRKSGSATWPWSDTPKLLYLGILLLIGALVLGDSMLSLKLDAEPWVIIPAAILAGIAWESLVVGGAEGVAVRKTNKPPPNKPPPNI